jgi:hypothetical protein
MSLGISTLRDFEQLRFFDITMNMGSDQSECLDKMLGLVARDLAERHEDVAHGLGVWIRDHVLSKLENYCSLLEQELAKKAKP